MFPITFNELIKAMDDVDLLDLGDADLVTLGHTAQDLAERVWRQRRRNAEIEADL